MARVSVTHVVLFIAVVGVAALVVGTMTVEVGRYAQSAGDALDRETAVLDAEIDVVNDPEAGSTYDGESETVTLYVENVGGATLEPDRLEVLVDGEYAAVESTQVLEGDYWRPGRVLEVTVNRSLETGDHRALVRIDGAEDVLEWEYRIAAFESPDGDGSSLQAAGASSLVRTAVDGAVDCEETKCTVDASETRRLELAMYTDPVQLDEPVEYAVNDSSVATVVPPRGTTGPDGRNATTLRITADGTVAVELDAGWDDDVLYVEVVNASRPSEPHGQAPENLSRAHDGMEGSGTDADPYIVTNDHELQAVSVEPDAHYVVGNPIDASLTGDWHDDDGFEPIAGTETGDPFTGSLEGDGYAIEGLTIDRGDEDAVGLFGAASGATIADLSLESVAVAGDENVGGLVGRMGAGATITGADVSGSVTATTRAGGLVGRIDDGSVTYSSARGDVSAGSRVGGLAGWNEGEITRATANATVLAVDGEGAQTNAGGLVGVVWDGGTVSESAAGGSVHAEVERAGGLVGWLNGTVTDSYAEATVSAPYRLGGLAGRLADAGTVSRAYATGEVVVNESGDGGITDPEAGGLVGMYNGTLESSTYWNTETTGQSSGTGTGPDDGEGLTTAEMTGEDARATMAEFAFDSTWTTTEGTPVLLWETFEYEGDGTAANPYVITDAAGLQGMVVEPDAHYVLGTDVDATETGTWNGGDGFVPVGSDAAFTGSLDGNGYAVDGLSVDRGGEDGVGLFAETSGASIADLSLDSVDVAGNDDASALAGRVDGGTTVTDVSVTGSVSGENRVGGLVGSIVGGGTISHASADVTVSALHRAGGVVGRIDDGSVTDASARGEITGGARVGGLAGWNEGEITRATANATVRAVDDEGAQTNAGGLVGVVWNGGTVSESAAGGSVRAGAERAGGLVGYLDGAVVHSRSSAAVEASNWTGGIAGRLGELGTISRSFAVGNVSAGTEPGGLVGYRAEGEGEIVDAYWDAETTGQGGAVGNGTDGGTKLSTDEMTGSTAAENMSALDFATVWTTTDAYPELRWREGG